MPEMTKMRLCHPSPTFTIDGVQRVGAIERRARVKRHSGLRTFRKRFIMNFQGARIVIIGGTSGLGFATAEAAAREGASIVIGSSSRERIDRAVAAMPSGTQGFTVDVSREDDIARFFRDVGAFDHLVYTAGESLTLDPLSTMSLEVAREAFTRRYWGALAAVKYGRESIRPGGSIVLTTGVAKDRPQFGWTVAASICGAVDALTRALAIELAPIRVNAVSPGVVRTPLWGNLTEADRETLFRSVGEALPVGRIGEPSDIAEAYLYLMRERFTTGQVITVDGGTVLV
jgi:NAD(P)-dependent dehydrogenase (short-subunit alcohol dehydrogenase family)